MSNDMKSRFTRAHKVLLSTYNSLSPENQQDIKTGKEQFCSRWLRNEVNLWEGYKEDPEWVINGCACDPNHPDNLSDMVIKNFISLVKLGIINDE